MLMPYVLPDSRVLFIIVQIVVALWGANHQTLKPAPMKFLDIVGDFSSE